MRAALRQLSHSQQHTLAVTQNKRVPTSYHDKKIVNCDNAPPSPAVRNYARWIGLDVPSPDPSCPLVSRDNNIHSAQVDDRELLWVAEQGLAAPLPQGWVACRSRSKDAKENECAIGKLYYFNTTTGESSWEHPLDDFYRQMVVTERERYKQARMIRIRASAKAEQQITTAAEDDQNSTSASDEQADCCDLSPSPLFPPQALTNQPLDTSCPTNESRARQNSYSGGPCSSQKRRSTTSHSTRSCLSKSRTRSQTAVGVSISSVSFDSVDVVVSAASSRSRSRSGCATDYRGDSAQVNRTSPATEWLSNKHSCPFAPASSLIHLLHQCILLQLKTQPLPLDTTPISSRQLLFSSPTSISPDDSSELSLEHNANSIVCHRESKAQSMEFIARLNSCYHDICHYLSRDTDAQMHLTSIDTLTACQDQLAQEKLCFKERVNKNKALISEWKHEIRRIKREKKDNEKNFCAPKKRHYHPHHFQHREQLYYARDVILQKELNIIELIDSFLNCFRLAQT